MNRQNKRSELPPWLVRWAKWLQGRSRWLANHLLWIIFIFLPTSPFILQFVSVGLEHLFFPELYTREPTPLAWKQFGLSQACDVLGASGIWISLRCAGKQTIAPLAGVQLPTDHQEAAYVSSALDQLWKLTNDQRFEARLTCVLATIGPTDKPSTSLSSFAECTLGGRPIPELLVSPGMPLAPAGSPALQLTSPSSQPGYRAQARVAGTADTKRDTIRTTLLAIEGWMATILGFLFVSLGLVQAEHMKAQTRSSLLQAIDDALEAFEQSIEAVHAHSAEAQQDKAKSRARIKLRNLKKHVLAFLALEHKQMDGELQGDFATLLEKLEKSLIGTPMTLPGKEEVEAFKRLVERVTDDEAFDSPGV